MKNKEECIIDNNIFTQLKLLSNVIECCIDRSDKVERIYFHETIDKTIIEEIIMFIKDKNMYKENIGRMNNNVFFELLKVCHYLDIKDMIDMLTDKIACDIMYMNKEELEFFFS
jgi:hypothetical protein